MKHFLCPNDKSHGELMLSKYTPGAYKCTQCGGIFDEELDLKGKSVKGLSPKQEKFYYELIHSKKCKISSEISKYPVIEKFLCHQSRSLLIVGSKNQMYGYPVDQVTVYHNFNRINIHCFDKILIDKTSFGPHSILVSNLLDVFNSNYPEKEIYIIN